MNELPNDAYWVFEDRFMAGPYPGKLREEDAIKTLSALSDAGVTHFFDLTFPKGESSDMLEPYWQLLDELSNGATPGYSRRSIVDLDVPSEELMTTILGEISSLIDQGEVVYVHCWGGVGRTGTVVACHLIDSGMTADEALLFIEERRRGLLRGHRPSPETSDQEEFVRNWGS